MASPLHIPAAVAESEMRAGDKENLSEDGGTVFKRPALHKEVPSSARGKKKAAGFNLRKSIAWNPAFFTEEGVLDTSELSVLIGSELVANGSPSSDVNRKMSPLCRPGRYGSTSVLREVADNPCEKSSAKLHWTGNHGKRLFSSAKTPQRDERKAPLVIQNRSSARNIEKGMPRVPAGSAQKRVPNSTSIALMSRTPKKPISSLHMAPRSTTPVTTLSKSNKKFAPVKTESIHRVPVLLPKSKINSGPSMETDLVPAVASRYEETNGSVTSKNPEICISSLAGTPSTIAKPSALRMPSHSVGFFTQENAHISHGNAAERNTGRFSAGNTSLLVKPPRHKQPVDLNSGLFLSNLLSTNRTTTTNLVSQPVITESNTNNLVSSEKRSLSKIISTYSSKSGDVNFKEQPEVCCSLAGSGATIQPLTLEKNKGARNSMTIVHKDTTDVQRKVIIKEIEPIANLTSFKATCSTRSTMGSKLPQPCISSESNDLSYQNKKDTGSVAATDLENSCVGEKAIAISFSEDQMPTSGSSSDGSPDRADRKYILNDSLYDDSDFALSEEPNTDGGTNHEINKASLVTEDPLLHVGCEHNHSLKRTKCSPVSHRAPMTCMGRQNVLSAELNTEDKMVFGSNKLLAQEGVSHIAKDKEEDRSRTDTILRDHLKNLVPFTEEWLAVMEAFGQEVLEQKSGTVQNSPPDKTAPEPSPWSPVKRKAQDVGPFDCTKYSKNVRTSVSP